MKNNEIILSIETSCDDTSISICKNGKIITTLTKTTLVQHKKYGGIVPEIAARGHEQNLAFLCVNALKNSKISFANLTKIAYTNFPGLPGSLHIGKIFANSLGFLLNIPVVPINHLLGHVFSFSINKNKKIEYPFIGLVISGGNTIIYLVKNIYECSILNQTKDDAVGETLDKIGRLLGYEYPGGIWIDKNYNKHKTFLPINIAHNKLNFSFSGIKTYTMNLLNSMQINNKKIDKILIGSSIFKWIIDDINIKINYFTNVYKIFKIRIGGGCCASNIFKSELKKNNSKLDIKFPEKKYCGDNAAMIANLCYLTFKKN